MATLAAVLSVLGTIGAVLLHRANLGAPGVDRLWIGDVIVGAAYPVVGAVLVRRRPDNPVGWVLTSASLIGLYALGGQWFARSELVLQRPLPMAELGGWLNAWGWLPHLLLPSLVPLLFPDGTLLSPRWRTVLRIALGGAVLVALTGMLGPVPLDASLALSNPWAVLPEGPARVGQTVGLVACFVVATPLGLLSAVLRLRRAQHAERLQLLWLVVGGALLSGSLVLTSAVPEAWEDAVWSVGLLGALGAIAVAVVRSRTFDVEVVLNRTLVALILGGLVLAVHLTVVSALSSVMPASRTSTVLVAVLSLLAVAAYERVQRLVDRLLLGGGADPYAVVVRVGDRLDLARGPADALALLADELRTALRLPYVALVPARGTLAPIVAGTPVADAEVLPITSQGQLVGTLRVGIRRSVRRFTPLERSLLEDVCRRAAALVMAADLVDDLQRSRERAVAGREEERRRLRHDLHDGVGPRLAGMALQLDSLADRLVDQPELHARAERVRSLMRETLDEVRRVVDDLRPPALDELGLVGALHEHLGAFRVDDGPGPNVVLEAAELPCLPAAVEVAAYRIAVEATTNAVRHGGAHEVRVRLTPALGRIEVVVSDDGHGIDPGATPGVGLASMTERAEELGGRLDVRSTSSGTVLRAELPIPSSVAPAPIPAPLEPA